MDLQEYRPAGALIQNTYGSTRISPRWGSNTKYIWIYKNIAPLWLYTKYMWIYKNVAPLGLEFKNLFWSSAFQLQRSYILAEDI